MLHVVYYDGSSKQSGRRQASISLGHLGSDIIILAETSIIICWPLGRLPVVYCGVVFDSRLSMEAQVAQTAKSCYYQLRNIGQIRSSITEGACRTLVHALVTSRLDYGNGLLYGIPQATLQRLQRIQNCAARLITRTRKYEHITPVLRLLHWLPIRQRTLYKLLVLTYCAVNATAPSYLVQLLHNITVSRTLRSGSSTDLLSVPPSRTVTHGDRCFSVASPTLWNNLPVSLRTAKCLTQFRSQLKTHLFKVAFT